MQPLNGFIKVHRKLIQWDWYKDGVAKDVFLHLLITAKFTDEKWKGRTIKRGQCIIGTQQLADDLGFSRQQIRTALSKLQSTNEITIESTNKFSIITITNWDEYQSKQEMPTIKSTKTKTNKQPALSVTKVLQSANMLKNLTSKTTNKKEIESAVNALVSEINSFVSTSRATNEQPTNNQQVTNNPPQYKNNKNIKECKENNARAKSTLERELARRGITMEHYLELKNQ